MSLLTPLGLIALSSIIALIIIYIIRPNYQQKFVSTTYVWKLSLKYKKKRIPTSKLRNILLIIAQILILLMATAILTTPSQILRAQVEEPEVVIVIDSSASMRTTYDGKTRFERAVEKAKDVAETTFAKDGTVTVFLADDSAEPTPVIASAKRLDRDAFDAEIDSLILNDQCSFGTSDIEKSVEACAGIFANNPKTEIYVYTDTQYPSKAQGINVVDVTDPNEWNAAILSATAEKSDGYYLFIVEIAVYNRSQDIELSINVNGVNGNVSSNFSTVVSVDCINDTVMRVVLLSERDHSSLKDYYAKDALTTVSDIGSVYSFDNVSLSLLVDDCLAFDDNYSIYGGTPETLNVEYYSSEPNTFFSVLLDTFRSYYEKNGKWDFFPSTHREEYHPFDRYDGGNYFYIFEHVMPEEIPSDGVVFLFDPDVAPRNLGFTVIGTQQFENVNMSPVTVDTHYISRHLIADEITISRFQRLGVYDTYTEHVDEQTGKVTQTGFKVLLEMDGRPVLMIKDEGSVKVVVMSFNIHYSNISMQTFFPLFFQDMFDFFIPKTTEKNSFAIGETVTLRSRGETLSVRNGMDEEIASFDSFPATTSFSVPGSYVLSQQTYFDPYNIHEEMIYVKMPIEESNVFAVGNTLVNPYKTVVNEDFFKDLLLYFAAALVVLLFVEWILQAHDNM